MALATGKWVVLQGLSNDSFNGRCGQVVGFASSEKDILENTTRAQVMMVPDRKVVRVRPEQCSVLGQDACARHVACCAGLGGESPITEKKPMPKLRNLGDATLERKTKLLE